MSFDKEVVARALAAIQNCDGNEYLEKIIQVPFEIPMATGEKLNQIFFNELDLLFSHFSEFSSEDMDQERWNRVFWSIINPSLKSVRDIKRLINCFQMKCNLGLNELDWIDLLAITTIQVFHPAIYRWIISNKSSLTGGLNSFGGLQGLNRRKIEVYI